MTSMKDILPELNAIELDSHEAIEAVRSALNASGSSRSADRTYDLTRGDDVVAQATYNRNGVLWRLSVSSNLWPEARATIVQDAQLQSTRVARTALFSYREIKGAYTVPGWLQLRPVATSLQDRTAHQALTSHIPSGAPLPFAVEVSYRWSNLPFLESHRRHTAIQRAMWLLATFIDIPIFSLTAPYAWAFLDISYALVACGLSIGLDYMPDTTFSDISQIPRLTPALADEYFASLGIGSSEFRIPDLQALYARFLGLPTNSRLRFLRCCAFICAAANPAISRSQRLVSLVSAIEPLLEVGKRCPACKSRTGIVEQFRAFLNAYVRPSPEVKHIYEATYSSRSKIVHGGWNPDVDEPFFSLYSLDQTGGLAAWAAAKQGAINWLNAQ